MVGARDVKGFQDVDYCQSVLNKTREDSQVWMKIQGLFDNYNKDDKGHFKGLVTKSNLYSISIMGRHCPMIHILT
jgi:hypothetical protein